MSGFSLAHLRAGPVRPGGCYAFGWPRERRNRGAVEPLWSVTVALERPGSLRWPCSSVPAHAHQTWSWAAPQGHVPVDRIELHVAHCLPGGSRKWRRGVILPKATSRPSAGKGRSAFRWFSQGHRHLSRVSTDPGAGDMPARRGALSPRSWCPRARWHGLLFTPFICWWVCIF